MGLVISLLLIAVIVFAINHYCRKLLGLRRGLDESKKDLDELFARRDQITSKLQTDQLRQELIILQENINFLTEFHNLKAREYNDFAKSRAALMASNILKLKEGSVRWLKRK